ncbi:hypothetical protein [Pseudoxanthomonas putridarboris]|uniref:Uncharacterized protein n=1 Tax=Pseudoxanthomonas putridarboris TaxID=752605 RepID=A0ABU9J1J9_9GAMM
MKRHLQDLLNSILEGNGLHHVSDMKNGHVSEMEVSRIIDVLLDELSSSGLDENDEPNTRGLMIEEIIDALSNLGREEARKE